MQGKDIANAFLGFVNYLQTVNYKDFYFYLAIYGLFLYFLLLIIIFRDASRRYKHSLVSLFVTLCCVFPPNILIYLLIRPTIKNLDQYWVDLERRYLQFETSGMDICTCGEQLRPSYLICPRCNKKIRNRCANCQHVLGLDWQTCPYCLTPTGYVEEVLVEEKNRKKFSSYIPNWGGFFSGSYMKIGKFVKILLYKIGNLIEKTYKFIKVESNLIRQIIVKNSYFAKVKFTETISKIKIYIKNMRTVNSKTEVYYKEIRPVVESKTQIIHPKRKKKHGHKNKKTK